MNTVLLLAHNLCFDSLLHINWVVSGSSLELKKIICFEGTPIQAEHEDKMSVYFTKL